MSSLYVHIPFCVSRCLYCDFFSTTVRGTAHESYVALLLQQLKVLRLNEPATTALKTLYLGGGTPSVLKTEQLVLLLSACRELFGFAADAEMSIEVNPATFTGNYLQRLREIGFNRLSIGVQSFHSGQLLRLGRCHDPEQSRQTIAAARSAGFDNLSLDLMFALPGQKREQLENEIDQLLHHEPEHISVYGLTIEQGTAFARQLRQGRLETCDDDDYASQYELLRERLTRAGYEHYELSNFARTGYRCRHNQVYWRRQSCLALGAGAHGFCDRGWGERWHVPADLEGYRSCLQRGENPAEVLETFDRVAAMKEYAYLALRTSDGIERRDFVRRFGCSPEKAFPEAQKKLGGQLHSDGQHWYLNPSSWLLYDHLISAFL